MRGGDRKRRTPADPSASWRRFSRRLQGQASLALLFTAIGTAGCSAHDRETELQALPAACAAYADYDPSQAPAAARAAITSNSARFLGVEREDGVHTPGVPALLARGRVQVLDLPETPCGPSRSRLRDYLRTYNQTLRADPRF